MGHDAPADPKMFASPQFSPEQQQRVHLMQTITQQVTTDTADTFVLKGGTALLLAYGLPRYSTDLDYDAKRPTNALVKSVERGAQSADVEIASLTTKKDTATTKRYMLHYAGLAQPDPLKIEVSFRAAGEVDEGDITVVHGFRVYKIERLAFLKIDAFLNREKARDVFDVWFLATRYADAIGDEQLKAIADAVERLGEDGLFELMDDEEILQTHDLEQIALELVETVRRLCRERGLA